MAFRFEHLEIWKEAISLAKEIYSITKKFPRDELYALGDQIRRAASSIAANIAEGAGSSSRKDFSHYLDIAVKSISETVSHLYLAEQQGYISANKRIELYRKAEYLVKRIQSLKKSISNKQ